MGGGVLLVQGDTFTYKLMASLTTANLNRIYSDTTVAIFYLFVFL